MTSPISPVVDCTTPITTAWLKGKSALVTGGASGLGAGIVRAFAEAGCPADEWTNQPRSSAYVTLVDLNSILGEEIQIELRSLGLHANFVLADVTDWDELVEAFEAAVQFAPHKGLDVVCPNAGIVGPQLVSEWSGEGPRAHPVLDRPNGTVPTAAPCLLTPPPRANLEGVEVNLLAVMHCAHLAVHYFKLPPPEAQQQGSKAIVFTGSIMSYLDCPGAEIYGVGKLGVRGLFKGLRGTMPGVRISMVAPTYVQTPLTDPFLSDLIARSIKFASVSDVTSAFLRLASDPSIDGRSLAVGPDGVFDLRDDFEGFDGGVEMRKFVRGGALGEDAARAAWCGEKREGVEG
ncbi:MAG: hypothetical protein M1839_004567 [Geoglossum umbratile]|nr:MAG: hypothetical protein M1839_004567 [Geoglossum umbratile]